MHDVQHDLVRRMEDHRLTDKQQPADQPPPGFAGQVRKAPPGFAGHKPAARPPPPGFAPSNQPAPPTAATGAAARRAPPPGFPASGSPQQPSAWGSSNPAAPRPQAPPAQQPQPRAAATGPQGAWARRPAAVAPPPAAGSPGAAAAASPQQRPPAAAPQQESAWGASSTSTWPTGQQRPAAQGSRERPQQRFNPPPAAASGWGPTSPVRTVVDAEGRAPQSPPQGLNLQQNFRNQWDHVDPAIMNQGPSTAKNRRDNAIPVTAVVAEDYDDRMRLAARAMYYKKIGVKVAARQFQVTLGDLRHYYDHSHSEYLDEADLPQGGGSDDDEWY